MKKVVLITGVTAPIAEKARKDGKASRLFVTATFTEALQRKDGSFYPNPFTSTKRNIWQRHAADGKSAAWGATSPDALKELMNASNPIPGEIVSRKVAQFPVLGADGKQNKTLKGELVFGSSYTTVVLGNEDIKKVFSQAGHEIVGEVNAPAIAEGATLSA